jgi:hypothetical protein
MKLVKDRTKWWAIGNMATAHLGLYKIRDFFNPLSKHKIVKGDSVL